MPRKLDKDGAQRTPLRSFRAEDEVWLPALAKAASKDETLSQVLRRALREYIKEEDAT